VRSLLDLIHDANSGSDTIYFPLTSLEHLRNGDWPPGPVGPQGPPGAGMIWLGAWNGAATRIPTGNTGTFAA